MADIAAADFVGCCDGGGGGFGGGGGGGFRAEGALFLDYYYYAVAWDIPLGGRGGEGGVGGSEGCTDFGVAVHLEDFDAFCYCGAGVVDDVQHSLERVC